MAGVETRPRIVALLGATGSGKSTVIKRELLIPVPRRLLVWDFSPISEYTPFGKQVDRRQFAAAVDAAAYAADMRLVLKPRMDPEIRAKEFELFCEAALKYGSYTVVVEELRFVTRPSWAPEPWSLAILTGRKLGLSIIGTSQRPAHIDKDFLSSATVVRVGNLGYDDDRKAAAIELGVPVEDVATLQPLDWIQLDRETRTLTRGRLFFPR